jgi:hypothetical protein
MARVTAITLHHNQHPGPLVEELRLTESEARRLLASEHRRESLLGGLVLGAPVLFLVPAQPARELIPVVVGDDPRR